MTMLTDLCSDSDVANDTSRAAVHESELSLAIRDAMSTHAALTSLAMSVPRSGIKDPAMRETARYLGHRWEVQVSQVCAAPARRKNDLMLKAELLRRVIDFTEATMVGPTTRLAASLAFDVLSGEERTGP